jgi:hypothetical protein
MHLRRCDRCRDLKPISEFAWRRRRGRRQPYNNCRACRAQYLREHCARHRDRYVAQAVRRKKKLTAERADYLIALFRERHCVDCDEDDPLVLEFDHLADKKFNISAGLRNRNWHDVLDEIAKCDVVCANCHRRRTARRGRWTRVAVPQQGSLAHPTGDDSTLPPD